ncbi:Uncharacterized protein BP5553_03739 [Venustampulla echinocandica]|uniref:Aminoglycoside phosphotransferase domain-containing protein n=1 Tax=Venustampulla echinocandica TaxID=2656787 RepID=A0A370TV66_9HELO|nr:Uncharacterized protein BP5553_03739 [Venustampulla echinocandica]RDL39399.1 Uncharacterized protein BP5553_03739 [Venustampulla echinocandica]
MDSANFAIDISAQNMWFHRYILVLQKRFEWDIHAIYVSGDPARLTDLNLVRRTAGENVISRLLETINCDALCARAETLRDGIKCTVNLPSADTAYFNFDVLGGCNYHGSIVFEDGKTWLARFRLPNHNEPPLQERNFDRCSEFATYRFLARTAVPVPEVYDCADDDDPINLVGAGYILLEKLAGKPLAWDEASDSCQNRTSLLRLRPEWKLDPIRLIQFFKRLLHRLNSTENPAIKTGEIASSAPLDQYLVYMSLLDYLPVNESGPFFLRHVDSRDTNFLVDNDYNITGIIDWELAIVTSKGSAFQSPLLLYNLGELYHEGLSTPSEDERRLSKILREEKRAVELSTLAEQKPNFRVDQVIETDPWDRQNFVRLFSGWWKATNGVETFDWDAWYKQALDKYGDGGL